MGSNNEIKRKHFRFPAYSDETGVKINREGDYTPFSTQESWILTGDSTDTSFYTQKQPVDEPKELRRSLRQTHSKAGHSLAQKEELKRHRTNLPDYTKRTTVEVTKTGKKQLFGDMASKPLFRVKEKKSEVVPSVKREYSGRSYFVPKYIPASIIPEEEPTSFSEADLMQSMRKTKESYLLFDNEQTPYQERKDHEPSVKKFPSTEGLLTDEVPRKEKKRMALNRSLDGLIAKETNDLNENNYFK